MTAEPCPCDDDSDPALWHGERQILKRLAAGETLVLERHYVLAIDSYAVSWYWEPKADLVVEQQWDGPVVRLLGRCAIRPVRVASGFTRMVLTEAAEAGKGGEDAR